MKTPRWQINWTNSLFLTLSPMIAVGGFFWLRAHGGPLTPTWICFAIYLIATGFGITAGYHRLFAHRTYEASTPVRALLLALGAAGIQHSAKKWSSDHRVHHQFVDRDADPYSIRKGFFYAHMGWVFLKDNSREDGAMSNVPDLRKDRWVEFQHDHYLACAIAFGFLLPTAICALWGDALGGLLIVGFLRVVLNHHITFCVNSLAHFVGNQPYSDKDSSRDNWIVAFLTYGEGYHNFHHTFQGDYRNGIRPWHWDPTKWLIQTFRTLGLARNLRVTPEAKILRARLALEERRLVLQAQGALGPDSRFEQVVVSARARLDDSLARWETLKAEYRQAQLERKRQRALRIESARDSARARVEQLRGEIHAARAEFRSNFSAWRALVKARLVRV